MRAIVKRLPLSKPSPCRYMTCKAPALYGVEIERGPGIVEFAFAACEEHLLRFGADVGSGVPQALLTERDRIEIAASEPSSPET